MLVTYRYWLSVIVCKKTGVIISGLWNCRNVRRILVRGSVPPCRLGWRKFWKFDYEMVHSGVSLNKFVVSIAPFSTPACPDCSHNIAWTQKTALFACFRFLIFHPFFPGDQLTPFAPMCGRPCETVLTFLRFFFKIQKNMTFYVFWVVADVFSNAAVRTHCCVGQQIEVAIIDCCVGQQIEVAIIDLFVCGAEPTSSALSWAMLCMVAFPDIQRRCHEELDQVYNIGGSSRSVQPVWHNSWFSRARLYRGPCCVWSPFQTYSVAVTKNSTR